MNADTSRLVVFCGPTIGPEEVRAVLPHAECLPPVEQGAVLAAIARRPAAVIAIVDGYFDRVPSVWHKEILWALRSGTRVVGASSMGALRAAELHQFGMIGVGEVFEQFRSGQLTDDDEVAVLHGPAELGYPAVSTAMVDLRDRFLRAAAADVISPEQAAQLTAVAKDLHYRDRTVPAVLRAAQWDPADSTRVQDFVAADGPGLKHRDALAMLEFLAGTRAEFDGPADPPDIDLPRTLFFDALQNEVERALVGRDFGEDGVLTLARPADEEMARQRQLLAVLARREVDRLGLVLSPEDVDAAVDRFRLDHGLLDPHDTLAAVGQAGLTWAELVDTVAEQVLIDRLSLMYRSEVDAGIARARRTAGIVTERPSE